MSFRSTIGDQLLSKVEGNIGDEYQESMVHKSQTVAFMLVPIFAYLVGAILAWTIPGPHAWLSLLVMLPIIGPEFIASGWLKARAPRPGFSYKQVNWTLGIINIVLAFIMIFGLAFNAGGDEFSLIYGGILGAVAAIITVPFIANNRKKKDEERLNATYED